MRLPCGCQATAVRLARLSYDSQHSCDSILSGRTTVVRCSCGSLTIVARQTQEMIDSSPACKLANSCKIVSQSCGCLKTVVRQPCGVHRLPKNRRNNVHVENSVCDVATTLRRLKFVRRSCGCRTKPSDFCQKCDRRGPYGSRKANVKQALGGLSLPRNSVVRLTDRPDMIIAVYRGR